jgi:hypothetical protein
MRPEGPGDGLDEMEGQGNGEPAGNLTPRDRILRKGAALGWGSAAPDRSI